MSYVKSGPCASEVQVFAGTPSGGLGLSRRRASAVLMGSLLAFGASVGNAAEPNYPARPVRMIVSYGAGNVTDTLARIITDGLTAQWGQPVTVENRPGTVEAWGLK